jgi:hypothetical protein
MLGVVLLSEYNELVHAFGNDQFRKHSAVGRSFSQDQEHHGQLSSSSGVSSSGSSGSPNVQYSSREQIHDEDEMIMEGNRRKQTAMKNNGNDGKTAGGDYKCRFKPSCGMAWEDQEQQQQHQDVSHKGLWALGKFKKGTDNRHNFSDFDNYCHLSVDA